MLYLSTKPVPTAKRLAAALGIRRINTNLRPVPRGSVVINWGQSGPFLRAGQGRAERVYNPPTSILQASNKLVSLRVLSSNEVPTVPFTTEFDEAKHWHFAGNTVYGRSLLRGSGGRGIVLLKPSSLIAEVEGDLRKCSLYTRYIRPEYELRVHIGSGKVLSYARKMRKILEEPPKNRFWIRNHDNGWIFSTALAGGLLGKQAEDACIRAVQALGLDFGAVDLIVTAKGRPHILEVNTAPGLEGATLNSYVDYFSEIKESVRA